MAISAAAAGIITAAIGAVSSLVSAAGNASKSNGTTNIQPAAEDTSKSNSNSNTNIQSTVGDASKSNVSTANIQPSTVDASKSNGTTSNQSKAGIAKAAIGAVGDLMSAAGNVSKGNGTTNIQPAATGYQTGNQNVASDERLKNILKTEDPIDCFAKIDAYLYKYTPEARSMYPDESEGGGVNGDENFGVMAQDLAANPITAPAVEEDENGYLMLNGGRLSSINTAMISELCRKVQELEKAVYGRG